MVSAKFRMNSKTCVQDSPPSPVRSTLRIFLPPPAQAYLHVEKGLMWFSLFQWRPHSPSNEYMIRRFRAPDTFWNLTGHLNWVTWCTIEKSFPLPAYPESTQPHPSWPSPNPHLDWSPCSPPSGGDSHSPPPTPPPLRATSRSGHQPLQGRQHAQGSRDPWLRLKI